MESRYVDVFISHKMQDEARVRDLKRRIEGLGVTCWIDADDGEMRRLQETDPVDYKILTDRVRGHLRTCRCLIFAYSAKSHQSRWMPWELGFFDGRWGQRLIGLYDLDEGATDAPAPQDDHGADQDAIGIPEFLRIYEELKPATLADFLQYAQSPRSLADRADVDIDRWANLVAGTMRDPLNISIDAWQFWISYHQAFWRRAFGPSLPSASKAWLDWTEAARTALAPYGKAMRQASPGVFEPWIQKHAEVSADAQNASRVPAQPDMNRMIEAMRIVFPRFGA